MPALDDNDDAREPYVPVLGMERGSDLYFVDALDAALEMKIAPYMSRVYASNVN
jgi:hypothetical protein